MAIIPYINPSRLKCDPETARCLRELCVVVNNYLRRANFVHTGNEQYELIADPSLVVRNVSGTTIVSDVGQIRFDQSDGFTVTEVSAGIARIDFTAPPVPPTLTVRESDNSVIVANVGDLAFNQATGFTVTDLTGGAAQVDLVFIPPDSVVPGTVDDSAFTESLAPVTNICQTIKHINGTVTIAAVDYPVTFTLSDTANTYSVPLVAAVSYETQLITLIDGTTIDAAICHDAGVDCCPPCDCACEGYDNLVVGDNVFTAQTLTEVPQIDCSLYTLTFTKVFCLAPGRTYDFSINSGSDTGFTGPCFYCSNTDSVAALTIKDGTDCTIGSSLGTDSASPCADSDFFVPNLTVSAITSAECQTVFVQFTILWGSETGGLTPSVGFTITVTEV